MSLNTKPETVVKQLSGWIDTLNESMSALEEAGVQLKRNEREVWEELRNVWNEMKESIDKVDRFSNYDKNLKILASELDAGSTKFEAVERYVENAPELHTKFKNACKYTSALAQRYTTKNSASKIFADPIEKCENVMNRVESKRQLNEENGCIWLVSLLIVLICTAYGYKEYGVAIARIVNVEVEGEGILVGVSVPLLIFVVAVHVFKKYRYRCKCQNLKEIFTKLHKSLKLAQNRMSDLSSEIHEINRCLSAMSDMLEDILKAKVSATSPPHQQQNTNGNSSFMNSISTTFWWCCSYIPLVNRTMKQAAPATAVMVNSEFVEKFKKMRRSYSALSGKLAGCEPKFTKILGINYK